ncbi:MAG: hypothetical protein A2Z83_07530 [Omnitrophica bacterium GWA2_52_8]|nr:MAG: hypothetical protein A2Z83_07530 [Omnitrophica bacterium GWA2_52_8]
MAALEEKMDNAGLKNLLTVAEFARLAGVSPQAIHQALRQQRIRAVRKGPIYLIEESELSRFFQ